jgi:hypothetical protein
MINIDLFNRLPHLKSSENPLPTHPLITRRRMATGNEEEGIFQGLLTGSGELECIRNAGVMGQVWASSFYYYAQKRC